LHNRQAVIIILVGPTSSRASVAICEFTPDQLIKVFKLCCRK